VEVSALLGLTPVLADVEPGTFNIDLESLEKAITPKTKVIIPVHLLDNVPIWMNYADKLTFTALRLLRMSHRHFQQITR